MGWYQSLHILEAMKCTQDLCGTPSVYGNGQENKHLCHKSDNVCGFTSVRDGRQIETITAERGCYVHGWHSMDAPWGAT